MHNKNLFSDLLPDNVEFLEFRYPKKFWLLRVWFEYIHCYFLSKKLQPFFWFAIHDMTPNVKCTYQAVYCHNPAPFFKLSLKDVRLNTPLIFFQFFYKFFYKINIHRNRYVIVQQDWIRKEFKKKLNAKNVVVAYPDVSLENNMQVQTVNSSVPKFVYPSIARVYKNFEVLLQAGEILSNTNIGFEIIITISGGENKYAAYLKNKFQHIKQVKFIGYQPRKKIFELYAESICLVFPSKLETWGLPITEMKSLSKPIFVADQPYAHETVGRYDKVCFFDSNNAEELAQLMKALIENKIIYDKVNYTLPQQPLTTNWSDLYNLLLS